MYSPVYTKQFSKDIKRIEKRRKNLDKLKIIIRSLLAGEHPDPIHLDHKLTGTITKDV